jgi:iron-sulfur cluster repair protein YtfE (RIC family)
MFQRKKRSQNNVTKRFEEAGLKDVIQASKFNQRRMYNIEGKWKKYQYKKKLHQVSKKLTSITNQLKKLQNEKVQVGREIINTKQKLQDKIEQHFGGNMETFEKLQRIIHSIETLQDTIIQFQEKHQKTKNDIAKLLANTASTTSKLQANEKKFESKIRTYALNGRTRKQLRDMVRIRTKNKNNNKNGSVQLRNPLIGTALNGGGEVHRLPTTTNALYRALSNVSNTSHASLQQHRM